ncbi:MAG: hypothetical protein Kow0098_17070 [Ignavibacteriaceae bacterium]
MKKVCLLSVIFVFLCGAEVFSQTWFLSAKSGLGQPFSSFGESFKNGANGIIYLSYNPSYNYRGINYHFTASLGYQNFGSKSSSLESYHVLPITLGVMVPFDSKFFVPYVSAEAGLFITEFSQVNQSSNETAFGFSPGAGFFLAISQYWGIDIQSKFYKIILNQNDINYLSYQAGLIFRI